MMKTFVSLLLFSFLLLLCSCDRDNKLVYAFASPPPCRFSLSYNVSGLLNDPAIQSRFITDVVYWEGQFHQDMVGYHAKTGLSLDGTPIDYQTGEPTGSPHLFSASSKESLHITMMALALSGDPYAQVFFSPDAPSEAPNVIIPILENKITSYEYFNSKYPGFGGYFPWYSVANGVMEPTSDFVTSTPALDNGQLIWSLYALIRIMKDTNMDKNLTQRYENQLDMMTTNALTMFYAGDGKVRAVVEIKNVTATPPLQASNYASTSPVPSYLDDPYEGELFTFYIDMFAKWPNPTEREKLWVFKRALLKSVDYNTPQGPVTLQKGWWFSAHEQWKIMVLPYLEVPICKQVFLNCEKARTAFSAVNNIPGMRASCNDVAQPGQNIPDYVSDAGIPALSFVDESRSDLYTPYGSFPLLMTSRPEGLVWYHAMINNTKMQGPHGSTEAANINGTLISPLLTWDTKITSVVAMLGGTTRIVSKALLDDGVLDRFTYVANREYSMAFPSLKGANVTIALPTAASKVKGTLTDFTTCTARSLMLAYC